MPPPSLRIPARFAGPPGSANGGYTSGQVAGYVDTDHPVTVTLRRPPPLETALPVTVTQSADGSRCVLTDTAGEVVAEAAAGAFTRRIVEPVPLERAEAAATEYRGLTAHPFPGCFVCGTGREPGDGMRLTPGRFEPGRTACVWTPDSSLAADPVFAWAALDCPGGWTSDIDARPLVLGRMTAVCLTAPAADQPYVVTGALIEQDGRKTFTATAMYDQAGRLTARAEHVWIAVNPTGFGQGAGWSAS